MLGDMCQIELWKFQRLRNRSKEEQERVIKAAKKLKAAPLIIDSTPSIDVNTLQSIIQKVKMKYDLGLVVVDYLQLMSGEGTNDNSRVSKISKSMKMIAMKHNLPVVVGSQLSRSCEVRDNKRPILSDLRDSGAVEQDADLVMMLYRDYYYSPNPDNKRLLEIIIRKFRNGEIGKIIVDYNVDSQHLRTLNPDTNLGKIAKKFQFE